MAFTFAQMAELEMGKRVGEELRPHDGKGWDGEWTCWNCRLRKLFHLPPHLTMRGIYEGGTQYLRKAIMADLVDHANLLEKFPFESSGQPVVWNRVQGLPAQEDSTPRTSPS